MRFFHLCVAAYMVFNEDSQHPSQGVESQVSALKSKRIDSSNKESLEYQEMRGKISLISSSIPSIHSSALFSCQTIVINVMRISYSCFPHKREQHSFRITLSADKKEDS